MTYYNFITYEVLLLIMALGVVNHFRHRPTSRSLVLGLVSFTLSLFLCVIMFWWMVDTVTYLKYEVLKSPLVSGRGSTPVLPT